MTSASELFHNRRSRLVRDPFELGFDSSFDRSYHQAHTNRRHNHHHNSNNGTARRDRPNLEDGEPLRRSSHLRHTSHRPSHPERESVQLDQVSSQSTSSNIINSEHFSSLHSRPRLNVTDRLPGDVLLARERLLERLRGVSLSRNRRSNRATLGNSRNHFAFGVNLRLDDGGDWESEVTRELEPGGAPLIDSTDQMDRLLIPGETNKRPPGLTKEALDRLQLEIFSNSVDNNEAATLRESRECSICLESFVERDELIRLPCGHRFHSCCLDPWVRRCGDCPYCRRYIEVTSLKAAHRKHTRQ